MSDVTQNESVRQVGSAKRGHLAHALAIRLPEGGCAIRGMGKKFAANPVIGASSLTVPIFTNPRCSGFGLILSLFCDSGADNGPFEFSWSLSLPSITCKTDKGLPLYLDAGDSDEIIMSGTEDLEPDLKPDDRPFADKTIVSGYTIHRYRPRIVSLFARILRWIIETEPYDVFCRWIHRDNINTWYCKDSNWPIANNYSFRYCQQQYRVGNAFLPTSHRLFRWVEKRCPSLVLPSDFRIMR